MVYSHLNIWYVVERPWNLSHALQIKERFINENFQYAFISYSIESALQIIDLDLPKASRQGVSRYATRSAVKIDKYMLS